MRVYTIVDIKSSVIVCIDEGEAFYNSTVPYYKGRNGETLSLMASDAKQDGENLKAFTAYLKAMEDGEILFAMYNGTAEQIEAHEVDLRPMHE